MSASPKFRKDNAMAFLKRTSAKPVSLIHNLLNAGFLTGGGGGGGVSDSKIGGINNTPAMNIAGGGGGGGVGNVGGLGVGKAVLLRAPADSRPSIEAMERYLYEVVAVHAVSCLLNTNNKDLAGNTPSNGGGAGIGKSEGQPSSRPFPFARSLVGTSGHHQQQAAPETDWRRVVMETARSFAPRNQTISNPTIVASSPPQPIIHWIMCPGAGSFDLHLMLASVQRNLLEHIASQLIPSFYNKSSAGSRHDVGPLTLADMDLPTLRQRVESAIESVLCSPFHANEWNLATASNMETNREENVKSCESISLPHPLPSTCLMPSAQEVLTALLVRALGFVEVSHPQDVGELIHAITTCHVSHLKRLGTTSLSSSSCSPAFSPISPTVADQKAPQLASSTFPLTTKSTARFPLAAAGSTTTTTAAAHSAVPSSSSAASSNTPLVVLEGLGMRDSYLSSLERQVGVEVPLRWALESLSQSHHAAFIITESFVGVNNVGGGGGGGGRASFASAPSYPHDLRKDSFFVQNITSRWALAVPPLVASRLNNAYSAHHHVSSANEEEVKEHSGSVIREDNLADAVRVKQEESAMGRQSGSTTATAKIEGSMASAAFAAAVAGVNNNNKGSAAQTQRNNHKTGNVGVAIAERDRMRRVSDQLAVMLTGHGLPTSLSANEQCRSTCSAGVPSLSASYFTNLCSFATASLQAVLTFTSTTNAYDQYSPSNTHPTTAKLIIRSVVTFSTAQRELVVGGVSGGSYANPSASSWSASGGGSGGGAPSVPIVATPKLSISFTFVSFPGSPQGQDCKNLRWN